jgi:sigma-B regulation protein RsbU (phosphoserine phosphatase)
VGVLDWPRFSNTTVKLEPGDLIVVYTDGVTEARDQNGDLYGDDRLVASLAAGRLSAPALVEGLLDEVMQFQSQQPRDDIAVVVIAVPGPPSAD